MAGKGLATTIVNRGTGIDGTLHYDFGVVLLTNLARCSINSCTPCCSKGGVLRGIANSDAKTLAYLPLRLIESRLSEGYATTIIARNKRNI